MERKLKAQAALDAAVLAAARVKQTGATDTEIENAVTFFFKRHMETIAGLNCEDPTTIIGTTDEKISASVDCSQATGIAAMMGTDEMPFGVDSASSYSVGNLDIAFMFDVSGSMRNGNRLVDLKAAAKEAIDILLPISAPTEVRESTRLAMASYSSRLNAGSFFEKVTGVPATRTYHATVETEISDDEIRRGSRIREMDIGLYDADTDRKISRLGPGAVLKVTRSELDNMTIAIELRRGHTLYHSLESVHLKLSGEGSAESEGSTAPFSLYGRTGRGDLQGDRWTSGTYTLRVQGYDRNGLAGSRIYDREIDFELFVDGDVRTTTEEYTLTSTCVWERDGIEQFTDAPPGIGQYFAHQRAWYRPFDAYSSSGVWDVGFNENGEQRATGDSCDSPPPLELTNDRGALIRYVSMLTSSGSTAGHLGVAWTWYLISDRWSSIFDGSAKPADLDDPSFTKAVVLMTDGAFNTAGHLEQGDSAAQARALCDNMKLKHIQIYSVAFKAPQEGKDVLSYCASNPGYYFDTSNGAELKQAYSDIALSLSALRLSR